MTETLVDLAVCRVSAAKSLAMALFPPTPPMGLQPLAGWRGWAAGLSGSDLAARWVGGALTPLLGGNEKV